MAGKNCGEMVGFAEVRKDHRVLAKCQDVTF